MLTVPAMLDAPPHFEAMRTCSIAVAAAGTTGPAIMNRKLDTAQRTGAFDDVADRDLRLMP
jgi:hypothetical protein